MASYTKHIIGPVVDGQQFCIICGEQLEDYSGQMSPEGSVRGGWAEGEIYRTEGVNPRITTTIYPEGEIVNECNKPV